MKKPPPTEDDVIRKLTLAASFGAGYVMGAKAGTQRYEQIAAKARSLGGMPVVHEAAAGLHQTASTLADRARESVSDTMDTITEKAAGDTTEPAAVPPVNGNGAVKSAGSAKTGAKTTSGPMAGATASGSAPDILT